MQYRDLTSDDVLQAGDEYGWRESWTDIDKSWIGRKCGEFDGWEFRRPLTPAETTAAERVRFEAEAKDEPMITPLDRFEQGADLPEGRQVGEYEDVLSQLCWEFWCAALGIDPTADQVKP